MHPLVELWRSTVGKKAFVAVSGLFLWIWIVLHVLGNLTVFSGPTVIDGYAAALHRAPAWLWLARIALVVAAAVHVAGIVSLTRTSLTARPRRSRSAHSNASRVASGTMRIGGALLLAFVVYHLLHLTSGVLHPQFIPGHVYANVVRGLRPAWVAAVYLAAALLLGLHLFHGLWAAARSLGVRPAVAARLHRSAVAVVSATIACGFAAVPVAVLTGWLR